jgi:tetratricopeptide (TPR) repeat protein
MKEVIVNPLKSIRAFGVIIASLVLASTAHASDNPAMDAEVFAINNGWAHIKYQVKGSNAQFAALEALGAKAAAVSAKYPGHAEPLMWEGIVRSEEAAVASTLKKLGYATTARNLLLKGFKIDPHAGKGGLAMSIGVLYYRVPGFPIAFGSTPKAEQFLKAGLTNDPNGLDSNFFYGDFLNSEGKKALAKTYLQKALNAPHDASRPVWDAGRRAEVRALLAKIG